MKRGRGRAADNAEIVRRRRADEIRRVRREAEDFGGERAENGNVWQIRRGDGIGEGRVVRGGDLDRHGAGLAVKAERTEGSDTTTFV